MLQKFKLFLLKSRPFPNPMDGGNGDGGFLDGGNFFWGDRSQGANFGVRQLLGHIDLSVD